MPLDQFEVSLIPGEPAALLSTKHRFERGVALVSPGTCFPPLATLLLLRSKGATGTFPVGNGPFRDSALVALSVR